MTNATLYGSRTFKVLVNKSIIGRIRAVSHKQAMTRATALAKAHGYSRFEIEAEGNVYADNATRGNFSVTDTSYNGRRSPYATPGFEERRAALIAAYKAA